MTDTTKIPPDWQRWPLFALLTLGGGILIGTLAAPGEWYAGLAKPAFNPPNWIFAPVWTLLYAAIAVAGWRCWRRDRGRVAMRLWGLQLALNFLWSPLFFAAHRTDLALGVILLLATILAVIRATWQGDRLAALLSVPYALRVGFATPLNASPLCLDPGARSLHGGGTLPYFFPFASSLATALSSASSLFTIASKFLFDALS